MVSSKEVLGNVTAIEKNFGVSAKTQCCVKPTISKIWLDYHEAQFQCSS